MVLRKRKVCGSIDVLDLHVEVESLAGQRVVEVDHSKRVVITNRENSYCSRFHASLNCISIDGAIAEDYQITNNMVIDSLGDGFSIVVDPATNGHCVFRRITLAANRVIRTPYRGIRDPYRYTGQFHTD